MTDTAKEPYDSEARSRARREDWAAGKYQARVKRQAAERGSERTCSKCGEPKPLEEFTKSGRVYASGEPERRAYCKLCSNAYQREHRLRRVFDLSLDDHAQMLRYQNGACAICYRLPKKLPLAVDHDHKTGLVRGMLCHRCNRLLGWVFDDAEALRRAAEYLDNPPVARALGRVPKGLTGRVNAKRKRRRKPGPKKRGV